MLCIRLGHDAVLLRSRYAVSSPDSIVTPPWSDRSHIMSDRSGLGTEKSFKLLPRIGYYCRLVCCAPPQSSESLAADGMRVVVAACRSDDQVVDLIGSDRDTIVGVSYSEVTCDVSELQ